MTLRRSAFTSFGERALRLYYFNSSLTPTSEWVSERAREVKARRIFLRDRRSKTESNVNTPLPPSRAERENTRNVAAILN